MTRNEALKMALEVKLGTILTHFGGEPRLWVEGADWHDEVMNLVQAAYQRGLEDAAKIADKYGNGAYLIALEIRNLKVSP